MNTNDLQAVFDAYFKQAASSSQQLLGLEVECFLLRPQSPPDTPVADPEFVPFQPLPMEGAASIRKLLEALAELPEWQKVWEHPLPEESVPSRLLGLKQEDGSSISVEPGGQFELSDAPRGELQEIQSALEKFYTSLNNVLREWGGRTLHVGTQPWLTPDQLPFFGKRRYQVMYDHMPRVGRLGRWMMKATSGTQVNLDYHSQEDLARKFVLLNRLSPFFSALFANSPIKQGELNGSLCNRMVAWADTDPYRCGLPEAFVNRNFQIQDYHDWTLNASPYLLLQGDRKWLTAGQSFQSLLEAPPEGLVLSPDDYDAHLNMLFPDIRIKHVIEVRVFDALRPEWTIAVPALLKGLVYSEAALAKLETWLLDFEVEQFGVFRKAAAKDGIRAEVGAVDFAKLGIRIMETALEGLGSSEEKWLLPYFDRYTKHQCMPADEVVAGFERSGSSVGRWLKQLLPDPNV